MTTTIKDLLVHLDLAPASQGRLEVALRLAETFGARVTALCLVVEPFLRAMMGAHLPADLVRDHLAAAEREAERVLAAAREAATRRGVELGTRCETGSVDRLPSMLARDARHADLVVVGQPDPEAGGADEAFLVEAAFMDSGRPALLVPHGGGRAMPPGRALVAWDGSREAARAVHDALPLLRAAEDVVILVVDGRDLGTRVGEHPGADVAAHLARHEVRARVKGVRSGRAATAELILAQAGEERADLLVMGGYGHSRLREMMLGGVTRHVLEHTTVPVLLSH